METWTIGRMLDWMSGYLSDNGDTAPQISSRWLVGEALGLSKTELFINFDRPLVAAELDILRDWVRRRAAGEPLQYITGKTFFRHIEVFVEPGVLIPRPETEVLVSEVLKLLPPFRYNAFDGEDALSPEPSIRIAEIGVGSGCVACSLAYEHPLVEVFATDISADAIRVSQKNVDALGLTARIHLSQADFLEGRGCFGGSTSETTPSPNGERPAYDAFEDQKTSETTPSPNGGFDVVVSNPPYIPTAVLAEIPEEVTGFEPAVALDGGKDGLDFYRHLVQWAFENLKAEGHFLCELHETTLNAAAQIAQSTGFSSTKIINDLAEKPRVLIASKVTLH